MQQIMQVQQYELEIISLIVQFLSLILLPIHQNSLHNETQTAQTL